MGENVLVLENLEIRPDELQALVDGRRIGLTVREFELLLTLAKRPDQVMQRPEIFFALWGTDMRYRDRSVDVLVRRVRNKLAQVAPHWHYIHTHFGVGYRLNPERIREAATASDDDEAPAGQAPAAPGLVFGT